MPQSKAITYAWEKEALVYIAVSEWGYGVHAIPAAAIRIAQNSVPAKAKRTQLCIYEATSEIEPVGFEHGGPVWPNGESPRLVGLTTTHALFEQSLRLTFTVLS
jgi:hypothetical protein